MVLMKQRLAPKFLLGLGVLLLLTQPVLTLASPAETKFAGKIIRSLSADASRILVGLKGGKTGAALDYTRAGIADEHGAV